VMEGFQHSQTISNLYLYRPLKGAA